MYPGVGPQPLIVGDDLNDVAAGALGVVDGTHGGEPPFMTGDDLASNNHLAGKWRDACLNRNESTP